MNEIELWESEIEESIKKEEALKEANIYNFYNEKMTEELGEIGEKINGKTYSIFFNGDPVTKEEYNEKKDQIIKRLTDIIKNENKIKKSVYELYKKDYDNDYNSDLKKDYISGFEINDINNMNAIGIFFSNINQFFTEVNKSNTINKNKTYIY